MLGYAGHYPPDPGQYLDHVHGQMQANIEFGNLEGALSNGSQSKCGKNSTNCVAFVEPTSYATYLDDNGFTVLNSANNHSLDAGWGGLTETTSALHAAHIAQTGLNGQMAIVTSNGVKVAFIGFAPYPGITNSLLDYATAASLIQQAKKKADFVVVYMHAGAEGTNAMHVTGGYEYFDGENRGNPETFAHMAVNAGADLVIASGPHVLRGMEFYRGHLIAYSLGDFAGYGNFGLGGVLSDSAILKVTMAADGTLISARVYPVRLEGLGQPYPDPTGTSLRLISTLSKQDFGASAAVIRADGTVVIPKGSGGG
jgi:poly-gamma-glutamate capsule biosynthesis protein CapA/YwtB (metallophosphatase superfamily)